MASRPALFIDRDGTLTEEVGYVNHPARLRLLPGSAEARGYFSQDVLYAVHHTLTAGLQRAGARLDGLYVCLHHPSEGEPPFRAQCECRKPKPGLLPRAAAELGLDLARSTMVGDKPGDLVPGRAVGAAAVLVLTGYGRGEWEYRRQRFAVEPDHVAADLLEAVEWALAARVAV